MSELYYEPYYKPLINDELWVDMILKIFDNKIDLSKPKYFFKHQFNVRKSEYSEDYFYEKCLDYLNLIKQAYTEISNNKYQLSENPSDIEKQVFNCDFIFRYNHYDEIAIFRENKVPIFHLRSFDKVICGLKGLITNKKTKSNTLKKRTKKSSFRYKNIVKDPIKVKLFYKELKRMGFIHSNTQLKDFVKVFSGEEIVEPIIWNGNKSELYYLIKALHDKFCLVDDLKHNKWKVTVDCFLGNNGVKFDRTNLRSQKVPETSGKIDLALKVLI
ncbi:hypothetical protein [Polaribacter aquimarinus]|uniref:Uncharacterized protein n=1 Tax=Polaribacter aquimarinus TaxID=2100726 RepID=A0A2U2JA72_9FLAO|nr:hypothetical protein [Polaribacter aquimarinus]PWG05222.1 hypothetical protein DIS07_08220 [Polaribacter aquimarinus]